MENLTLPKNDKTNEAKIILQTQLTRNFATKDTPISRTYKINHEQNQSRKTKPIKTYADQKQNLKTLKPILATWQNEPEFLLTKKRWQTKKPNLQTVNWKEDSNR